MNYTHPKVDYIPAEDIWIVLEDWRFNDDILIPAGFRSDLSSVLRFFWLFVAPYELSIAAPLVHDWLYQHLGYVGHLRYTRKQIDQLFLKIMEHEKVVAWKRTAGYNVVRLLGGTVWHEYIRKAFSAPHLVLATNN